MKRLAWLFVSAAVMGCGSQIRVRTAVDPDAHLDRMRTFSLLPTPERRDGKRAGDDDPMLVNSRSYRVLREAIRDEFEQLGYREVDRDPDFSVAYYASTKTKLDVTVWNYGYPWRPRWRGWGPPMATATEYVQGTVIIDVIDPATKEPLWRGSGIARTSDDPHEYREDIRRTVTAIIEKFPVARRRSE